MAKIKQSSNFEYDLLIIGCGPAGQRAAVQAAKIRKKVGIIDKREVVGGTCVHTGTIPSKSFKEAVVFLSGYRQRSIYGAGYRVKSNIEMSDLTFRCNHIMQTEIDVIHHQLLRNDIDIIPGVATFLDEHTLEVSSSDGTLSKHTAEHILIATGAYPRRLDHIPFDNEYIFDSDDILQIPTIPRELTVVGGGVIGTEYASMFAALGVSVTIIDFKKRLLGFIDAEIIECLQYQLRSLGVTLRLGEEVESCEIKEDTKQVVTRLKSGKVVTGEAVLFSAGRISATSNLGLENISLKTDDRGRIQVNDNFQTDIPHIYAAGDVIGFPALASTSGQQGRTVSCHAFEVKDRRLDCAFPYGIYSIPEIAYIGKNEEELTSDGIPYETGIARYKEIARGAIMGDENGMLKLLIHRETMKILGVHIIGEHAAELIHIGQAVMALDGDLRYFRDTVFNYPTLAECYKVAAYDGYNKIKLGVA